MKLTTTHIQVLFLSSTAVLFPRGPIFPLKQDSAMGVSRVTSGNEGTPEDGVAQGLYLGPSPTATPETDLLLTKLRIKS